jgi:hypothetical protein
MNHLRGLPVVVFILCVALATTGVFAAVPVVMSHQGRLLDATDHPLTGTYTLTYSIYDVPTGGAPLWTEDHVGVSVVDGLFSVELGATVPLSADVLSGSGGATVLRYLQVQVFGQSPISPRSQLLASPYAVASSRVSGDIETAPGSMTLNDGSHDRAIVKSLGSVTYVGTWDVTNNNSSRLYTDTDSAGLSVRIEDRNLIGLRVNKGINEPLPYTTLHISDPSGKSSSSLVCTNVSSDLDCDVDANSSGHAERNMRVRINDLESRLTLASDLDDDGTSDLTIKGETNDVDAMLTMTSQNASQKKGEANIAALLNGNVVVGCATHTDGSGVADNSCTMTTDDSSSTSTISGSKGKYYVLGSTHKYNGGGSSLGVVADVDADGHAERSIWEKVDNTGSISAVEVDINDDGVPDVGNEVSAIVSGTVLKSFFQTGDFPTQSQFVATTGSSGASSSVVVDRNHDGNPDGGCSMDAVETRSTLKTYFETGDIPDQGSRVVNSADSAGASSAVEVDFDGDGVADNSMQSTCDASSVKLILDRDSGRSRALMAAEDSGSRIVMD